MITSVVGAGGKTTFIKNISKNSKGNVIVSTTTKMRLPSCDDYSSLIISEKDYFLYNDYFLEQNTLNTKIKLDGYVVLDNIQKIKKNPICDFISNIFYFIPNVDIKNRKFMHISDDDIQFLEKSFDADILLESDGAKEKQLKFPKANEPVISKYTNMTVAILDVSTLGMEINEDNIYNVDGFCDNLGVNLGDKITVDVLVKLIQHENGLFKNAKGRRTLKINKVEEHTYESACEIKNTVDESCVFEWKR